MFSASLSTGTTTDRSMGSLASPRGNARGNSRIPRQSQWPHTGRPAGAAAKAWQFVPKMAWFAMRRCILLAVSAALLLAGSARADQNDGRLDPLFERLKATDSDEEASQIVRRIWGLWG